jgi:hypothetical protein
VGLLYFREKIEHLSLEKERASLSREREKLSKKNKNKKAFAY